MKQQKKQSILNCINIIYEDAHRCNLQPDFLKSNEAELETIARFLGVNTIEAYFTSVIFGLSCHHRTVDISDMFRMWIPLST